MTCNELDPIVTRFVDDECTAAERAAVVAHLRDCANCRKRVEAESTARHVLHAHAAVARTLGVPPPWRPRVFRLGQPLVPMVPAAAFVILTAIGLGVWWLRPTPVLAVGIVSDNYCQHDHRRLMIRGERECTLGCVRHGAEFVLVTETQVYRLRNQQLPELPGFANVRVKVEGTLENDQIVVARMAAADDNADPPGSRVE